MLHIGSGTVNWGLGIYCLLLVAVSYGTGCLGVPGIGYWLLHIDCWLAGTDCLGPGTGFQLVDTGCLVLGTDCLQTGTGCRPVADSYQSHVVPLHLRTFCEAPGHLVGCW